MSNQTKPRKRATFSIATIYMTCSCGGEVVSANTGSMLIDPHEDACGTCLECGKDVKIPKAAKK